MEGKKLLEECTQEVESCYQPFLHRVFCKQVGIGTCGIQSSVMLINAALVGQSRSQMTSDADDVAKTDLKLTEETMVKSPQTLAVKSEEKMHREGMTLMDVRDVLSAHGYQVEMHQAGDSTLDQFRDDAIAAISRKDSSCGIIVNFHLKTFGYGPVWGHHSPLVAYHKETDRFLVLDVAKLNHECWSTAQHLFNAMNVVDQESGAGRGYLIFHI